MAVTMGSGTPAIHLCKLISSQGLVGSWREGAISWELGVVGTLASELDLLTISVPKEFLMSFFFSSPNTAPYCIILHFPGEQIP